MFSILRFPPEILSKIFTFVSHPLDRRKNALVCKKFHQIIRQQSRRFQWLVINDSARPLYPDLDNFPFTHIGSQITDLVIQVSELDNLFNNVNEFFPNLKRLKIVGYQMEALSSPPIVRFPLQELDLSSFRCSTAEVDLILAACPHRLKSLWLSSDFTDYYADHFPDFLASLPAKVDQIEFFADYTIYLGVTQLQKPLAQAPTDQFRFKRLQIFVEVERLDTLRSFFSVQRSIEELVIFGSGALTREKLLAIKQGAIAERIHLKNGLPIFTDALETFDSIRALGELSVVANETFCQAATAAENSQLDRIREVHMEFPADERTLINGLSRLRRLRSVRLKWEAAEGVTDAVLEEIVENCIALERLAVGKSQLTVAGLGSLSKLKRLESLVLGSVQGSLDEAIANGFDLPRLRYLELHETQELTTAGIRRLIVLCPRLECFYLTNRELIDDTCLELLAENLVYLRRVLVSWCGVTASKIREIRLRFPHLAVITRL